VISLLIGNNSFYRGLTKLLYYIVLLAWMALRLIVSAKGGFGKHQTEYGDVNNWLAPQSVARLRI
jgi:hypothetical protein